MVAWIGVSLWPTVSHPALAGKAVAVAKLIATVAAATAKARWLSFSILSSQGMAYTAIAGFVGFALMLFCARLVRRWWQLASGEGAV